MAGSEHPVCLFRGRVTVLSEYGFFIIAADGRELPEPEDDTFSEPLKVCQATPEAVYFLSYPPMQEVDCTVESWTHSPQAGLGEGANQEQVQVEIVLSGETCSITGTDDYLTSIPLARPGRQCMRVQVSGRAESRKLYESNPMTATDGIEKWKIQIWPLIEA